MKGYKTNIELQTLGNDDFRKVLYTAPHLQLVLMNIKVGEDIGMEINSDIDQFFRIESGEGKCKIDNNDYHIAEGDAIVVPAGAKHNIINTGNTSLKLYTIYSPPNHQDKLVRITKNGAQIKDEKYNGRTTE